MQPAHAALARELADAIAAYAPLPAIEIELSLDDGYAVQRALAAEVNGGRFGGIKGGVTNPAAQAFFGLDHALLGRLYADRLWEAGCTVPYLADRMLECEVAIRIDAQGRPQAIAPAIEIVRPQLRGEPARHAANMVATNLAADACIVGPWADWDGAPLDAPMRLERDGTAVVETHSRESLNGPAKAVAWIVAEARENGFEWSSDTIVITGACGQVIAAERGHYRANFGAFGALSFEVA